MPKTSVGDADTSLSSVNNLIVIRNKHTQYIINNEIELTHANNRIGLNHLNFGIHALIRGGC